MATSLYTTSLSLIEGSNAFQITAEDSGHHSAIANATYILDSTPPALSIVSPAAGLITSAAQIRIQGTAFDFYFKELKLNGTTVPVLGGSFDETVSLATEGPNVFTLEASDFAGNKTTKTVTVLRDTTTPVFSGITPTEGSYVKTGTLSIAGSLTEANPDVLSINGAAGAFPFNVSLSEGNNSFELLARDKAGNETRKTIAYIRDSVSPVLAITGPNSSPIYTKETSFDVQGSFVEANFQSLTVAGVAVSPTGTSFSKTVPLVEGNNNILVRVTDLAGNTDEKNIAIIRDTTLPVITLTTGDDVTVSTSSFVIGGTVTEANLSQVTIDDVPVSLTGSQFSKSVTLASGQNQFRIKAKDLAGNEYEKLLRVYFDNLPPAAVTGLGTFQNAAQIKVFWATNASPNIAKYILARSPAFPTGWPGVTGTGEVVVNSGSETSFIDPVSLRPDLGPNYTYIVKAVDSSGRMSPAQSVSVIFGVAGQDVTGGTASDINFDQVNLHFSPTSLPNSQ
ncbi:MAG: hypothetical protein JNM63_09225, partial [Spirochaetia bacterium]|nr:hypothetical protein [Spirochaetia bacterium]